MRTWYFITFLTLSGWACEKNVNNQSSSNQEGSNITNFSTRDIPVEKALSFAWVDQLRIRELPSLNSRVLIELSEGDTLYYLNTASTSTMKLTLRDKEFDAPWLKVETPDGIVGWTYGGGMRFDK